MDDEKKRPLRVNSQKLKKHKWTIAFTACLTAFTGGKAVSLNCYRHTCTCTGYNAVYGNIKRLCLQLDVEFACIGI